MTFGQLRRSVSVSLLVAMVGALLGTGAVVVEAVAPASSPFRASTASAAPVAGGLGYTALLSPCRAVDTRAAAVTAGDLGPGDSRQFQVRGSVSLASQGGASGGCGVPSTASAVEVSITAVSPTGSNGFVRAFPTGGTPGATVLNYLVGRSVTNTGTIPLNTAVTQDLGVANFAGTVHLVVDVQGYFAPSGGASYVPLAAPCRVVDTRSAGGRLDAEGSRTFQVAGTGGNFALQGGLAGGCGVPDGVPGAEVSLSVVSPSGDGFMRLAPNDGTVPSVTFLNYTNGTGVTNTGSITLSNASLKDVLVRNYGAGADVVIDVQGYYTTAAGTGSRYQTLTPCRTVDTRTAGGPLGPGRTRPVQVAGSRVQFQLQGASIGAGCNVPQRAAAVEMAVTAVAPSGSGFTRLAPAGTLPSTTFLNFSAAGGVTNTGTVPLSVGGISDLGVTNYGAESSYVVDVLGYYEPVLTDPLAAETVEAGADHTCSVTGGGRVRCWGDNANGQLGDGTTTSRTSRSRPVLVPGLSGVLQVVSGAAHSCALLGDGRVSCWGSNASGQLGDGSTTSRSAPAVIALSGVVRLTAGASHTCALLSTGLARCWGSNGLGQLGDGSTTLKTFPTLLPDLPAARQLVAGGISTCALLVDTTVRCWGDNEFGQLGDGTTVDRRSPNPVVGLSGAVRLSLRGSHVCALLDDTSVRCWGNNEFGQLGDGTTTQRTVPVAVSGISGAVQVAAGGAHSCAVLADMSVRCWGSNASGELGDGSTTQRTTPVAVPSTTGVVELAAGVGHTCTVQGSGATRCWGYNQDGRLGDGTTTDRRTPVLVTGQTGIVQVIAGSAHSCALFATGTARCWGANAAGQLGDGTTTGRSSAAPVAGLAGAIQLSAGSAHTCALLVTGQVSCWGSNANGQLGDGSTTQRSTPANVLTLSDAVQVAAADSHTCAVRFSGSVSCWGAGGSGQLGGGASLADRQQPSPVSGLSAAIGVWAGSNLADPRPATCAVESGGGAVCWGNNDNGKLGDGTITLRSSPVEVAGLATAVKVVLGPDHACGLLTAGTVSCWGDNSRGQLGAGGVADQLAPFPVFRLADVVELAATSLHTCALQVFGTVRCWGFNVQGQVGDSTTIDRNTSTAVVGVSGATAIAAGALHSCAVVGPTAVVCWGFNASGQVGDASIGTSRPTAVSVVGLS